MHVFFLNFTRFFYSYFKVCVELCKKSDRTRCLAVSILEYNINWKGRTKIGCPRRVNIGDSVYRIV